MRIRRARVTDAARLADFGARSFAETFAADNRPEDMAAYLSRNYGVPQQTAELRDLQIITLLGELEGGPVMAYAQVCRSAPPACVRGREPVELWRFYVDRPWQGRGIGRQLLGAAEAAARELGGQTLWLSVWERNTRAIAFYAKRGFVDVGTTGFVLGGDLQTDRVMARAVAPAQG